MNAEDHARFMINVRPDGPDKEVAKSLIAAIEALKEIERTETDTWSALQDFFVKEAREALKKIRGGK